MDSDNVTIGDADWKLLKARSTASEDSEFCMGLVRCFYRGDEHRLRIEVPSWAVSPMPAECSACGRMSCLGVADSQEFPWERIVNSNS